MLSLCVDVCLDVNQGGTNRNLCTKKPVISQGQTNEPWLHVINHVSLTYFTRDIGPRRFSMAQCLRIRFLGSSKSHRMSEIYCCFLVSSTFGKERDLFWWKRKGRFRFVCLHFAWSSIWIVWWKLTVLCMAQREASVFGRRTFPVLRSTCSRRVTTYVGKPSAIGQPTRPTKPFYSFEVDKLVVRCLLSQSGWCHLVNAYDRKADMV